MKRMFFILIFSCSLLCAQDSQFYFIGEKIKEEYCPETIMVERPAKRYDCNKNEEDEDCYPLLRRPLGGLYFSKYKIVKILKGKYDSDTVEFYSRYWSEFGYKFPLRDKYVVLGLIKEGDYWGQNYIERIYLKNNKWILPYKKNYPFINYNITTPQKLLRSQRIKTDMKKYFFETNILLIYSFPEPYYKIGTKYATALYGFILQN